MNVKPKLAFDKATKKPVVIQRDADYDNKKHEWLPGYGFGASGYPTRTVEVELTNEATQEDGVVAAQSKEARFDRYEELKKQRAWLNSDLKEEYASLRAEFNA